MPSTARQFPQDPSTLQDGSNLDCSGMPNDEPAQAVLRSPLATRFGLRLKTLRQARGLTQLEIAVTLGIDRTFLSDLERGRKSLSLPFIDLFALGYGMSISELLADL